MRFGIIQPVNVTTPVAFWALGRNGIMPHSDQLWYPQPEPAAVIDKLIQLASESCDFLHTLSERLYRETGTRLVDWVDHLAFPPETMVGEETLGEALGRTGFESTDRNGWKVQCNPRGMFPPIDLSSSVRRVVLKAESVSDFLLAQQIRSTIIGDPGSIMRKALVHNADNLEVWACERWGGIAWDQEAEGTQVSAADRDQWTERALLRQRDFPDREEGFAHAQEIIREGVELLGTAQACARFFHAERRYWQSRNHAARIQKQRQDSLGLGWANHDHHTYRSSRESFRSLIESLRMLGFTFRERFYAGEEAGWGAQVLEQADARVTVFADVDLDSEELLIDFPVLGLAARSEFGTVGMWCALHGEAFLEAGMHHLEGQFSFAAARTQLADRGVNSMAPFTDFDYLKQCFTAGEIWRVDPSRLERLKERGQLSPEQASKFAESGAVGSHLEILQRDEGFNGFNQTGISDIIRKTDPRHLGD